MKVSYNTSQDRLDNTDLENHLPVVSPSHVLQWSAKCTAGVTCTIQELILHCFLLCSECQKKTSCQNNRKFKLQFHSLPTLYKADS